MAESGGAARAGPRVQSGGTHADRWLLGGRRGKVAPIELCVGRRELGRATSAPEGNASNDVAPARCRMRLLTDASNRACCMTSRTVWNTAYWNLGVMAASFVARVAALRAHTSVICQFVPRYRQTVLGGVHATWHRRRPARAPSTGSQGSLEVTVGAADSPEPGHAVSARGEGNRAPLAKKLA